MTDAETPEQTASRIAREAREVAGFLPFDERANLSGQVTKAVRDAVKFDATLGGAPQGREWEMEGLDAIARATEDYYDAALREKQSRRRDSEPNDQRS